jgi:transcription initiation factor IIE alpha subunit
MQMKCQSETCSGDLIKSNEKFKLESELGFSRETNVYQCKECGKKYIQCFDCDGEGFAETIHGYFDCETCNGSGLISIFN